MIDSLYDLSKNAVANFIEKGILSGKPFLLTPLISNDIFNIITSNHKKKLTPKLCREMTKWLDPSSVSLTRNTFTLSERNLIYSMKCIEHLATDDLTSADIFRNCWNTDESYSDEHVDIAYVLSQTLSTESRQHLKTLKLNNESHLSRKWPKKVSELLPSLETLSLQKTHLDHWDFKQLCQSFKNLKSLNLMGTGINHIKQIHSFKNLKHLCLRDIRFLRKEDLADLLKMKNLKSLDVHSTGEEPSKTMELYLKCGKGLPNLVALDCSSNALSVAMLDKLLTRQPNLRRIDINDTNAAYVKKTHPQILHPFPLLQLFTSDSLRSCLESLENYSGAKNGPRAFKVLETIHYILNTEISDQREEDLHDCFKKMLEFLKPGKLEEDVVLTAGKSLLVMCRGAQIEKLTFTEKQLLIKTLFEIRNPDNLFTELEALISELFNNDAILATSPDNIYSICEWMAEMIDSSELPNEAINYNCIKMLARNLGKLTPERRNILANDKKLMKKMLEFLKDADLETNFRSTFQVIRLLINKDCNNKKVVNSLFAFCDKSESNENWRLEVLHTLCELAVVLEEDIRETFFGRKYFSIIKQPITNRASPWTQKVTIILLVTLYSCSNPDVEENSKLRIFEDVQKFVITEYDGALDGVKVFKAIVEVAKTEESVKFAEWILGHFPEAPVAKKRRRR